MTRDELVEELLLVARDFINKKRLSDAGLRTMLRYLLTKIELSKLHQPTVSVSDCVLNNEYNHFMDIDTIGACSKCGSMKQYGH